MNEGMPFVEQMLRDHGEFFPFGYARTSEGSIRPVAPTDGSEQPESGDVIELLDGALRQGAESGRYLATASFIDVLITPPGSAIETDAVLVGLEHHSGYCVDVFFPYQRAEDGAIRFGELFSGKREGSVFRCE